MTFAIEYHVGAKYGSWITGNDRFKTRDAAQQAIADLTFNSIRCNATVITARAVELGARKVA